METTLQKSILTDFFNKNIFFKHLTSRKATELFLLSTSRLKKSFFIWVSMLLFSAHLCGQTTVTIGNPDAGTWTTEAPFMRNYNYGWSKMVYLQTEIDVSGDITHIAFQSKPGTATSWTNQTIYMRHTSQLTVTANRPTAQELSDNWTKVFEGDINYNDEWVNINITDFAYDNINNLEIYYENRRGTNTTNGPEFKYSTAPENRYSFFRVDNLTTFNNNTTATNIRARFVHIKLTIDESAECTPPTLNAKYNNQDEKTICTGGPAQEYDLTVQKTGGAKCENNEWEYAWYTGNGNDDTYWDGNDWNTPETWGAFEIILFVSPSTTTTYSVIARCVAEPDCISNPAKVTVSVSPIPSAPEGNTSQTFCAGATVADLLAVHDEEGTINWYNDENELLDSVEVLENGTYYASQTVNACESNDKLAVSVSISPLFTAGAILTVGESICIEGTPTLQIGSDTDASGGDNNIIYSWRSSADDFVTPISGAIESTYTPTEFLTETTSYRRYANDGLCKTEPQASIGEWTVTITPPPSKASTPSPENNAVDVLTNAILNWENVENATSYIVYFGTTTPGDSILTQTNNSYNHGTLENDMTYYWRIDTQNDCGITTGDIWTFQTVGTTCLAPTLDAKYNNEQSKTICKGDAYTLSAVSTGGANCDTWEYAWFTGDGNDNTYWNGSTWNNAEIWGDYATIDEVSPNTTTTYKVKVRCSADFDCNAADLTGVTVTVTPIPTTPVAAYNYPVCIGDSLILTASTISGASYSWTGPNDFTASEQNPLVSDNFSESMAGTYFVIAILDGCKSLQGSVTVEICDPTNIQHNFSSTDNNMFSIYPNPFSDYLIFENPHSKNVSIVLYNVAGELVYKKETSANTKQIHCVRLPAGIYYIYIRHDNAQQIKKMIKY